MIDKIDERNLAQERHTHFLHQCALMEKTFEARRINFHPVTDKHDVVPFITSFIHQRNLRTIAFSDSVSLHECDVYRHWLNNSEDPITGSSTLSSALLTANTKYLRINLPESSTCPETNTTAEWGLW